MVASSTLAVWLVVFTAALSFTLCAIAHCSWPGRLGNERRMQRNAWLTVKWAIGLGWIVWGQCAMRLAALRWKSWNEFRDLVGREDMEKTYAYWWQRDHDGVLDVFICHITTMMPVRAQNHKLSKALVAFWSEKRISIVWGKQDDYHFDIHNATALDLAFPNFPKWIIANNMIPGV